MDTIDMVEDYDIDTLRRSIVDQVLTWTDEIQGYDVDDKNMTIEEICHWLMKEVEPRPKMRN